MSPRHPLAKGPKGDTWVYWGGAALLIILALSIRWARTSTPVVMPLNPPPGTVQPATAFPTVTTPAVTAPPVAAVPAVPAVSPAASLTAPVAAPVVAATASVARILPPFWKFSLNTPAVNAILRTPAGMIWVAHERGLVKIEGDQITHFTQDNGLFPAPSATALAHDGKSLWIGTFAGLYQTEDGSRFKQFQTQDGLAHDMIWSLDWDGRMLWVGTQAGFSFSLPDGRFERVDKTVSNGGLADVWVNSIRRLDRWTLCGNDDGISIWDTAIPAANPSGWVTLDMFTTNLAHNVILSQLVLDNQMWVGTPLGLCRLEVPVAKLFGGVAGNWQVFTRNSGLPDNRVDALAAIGKDVWTGTPSGLARFRNGMFRSMTFADGLLASDVRTLTAAPDLLWVGTSAGIQALDTNAIQ